MQISHHPMEKPSETPENQHPWVDRHAWLLISILSVVLVVIGILAFMSGPGASLLAGQGTITGHVINKAGRAVSAEVFVLNSPITTLTDEDGSFTLVNVPSGKQIVMVGYQYGGRAYIVNISRNDITDLGVLIAVPDERYHPIQ